MYELSGLGVSQICYVAVGQEAGSDRYTYKLRSKKRQS